MQRSEYVKLDQAEEAMWWFAGLHANLLTAWARAGGTADGRRPLLDAGCGTGGLIAALRRGCPGQVALGLDIDWEACRLARRKGGAPVCAGSADRLPFADGALAAVFSADVLCHRDLDEAQALAEFHRCLAPGGVAILNLPAYGWLLSAHDAAVDNVRRYTRGRLCRLLERAGFAAIRATYWNTLLFPLMALRRTLLQPRDRSSDVMRYPAALDRTFRLAMRLENGVLRRGGSLPFGGSVLATAVRP